MLGEATNFKNAALSSDALSGIGKSKVSFATSSIYFGFAYGR